MFVSGALATTGDSPGQAANLKGQLLIADDGMADPRFAKTVILMIEHNRHGAMGVVVNRAVGSVPLAKLMEGLGVDAAGVKGVLKLHYGEPVESGVGFLVHGPDYHGPGTQIVNDVAYITTDQKSSELLLMEKAPNKKSLSWATQDGDLGNSKLNWRGTVGSLHRRPRP